MARLVGATVTQVTTCSHKSISEHTRHKIKRCEFVVTLKQEIMTYSMLQVMFGAPVISFICGTGEETFGRCCNRII